MFATPEPMFATPEPMRATPEPMFATPEPMFAMPEPMLETPEPLLEMPERMREAPEPLLETPEPLAAAELTYPRRIGFVPREKIEAELAPTLVEPFIVEADPAEIETSAETPFTIEAIEEQKPVAAFSEPVVEETIELLEVVDDEQDAVGTIDLSADFEELQVVEPQSDVEAIVPLEALDVEAFEIAAGDADALEILQTPQNVADAAEPPAPQLRVIDVDALKEFAATLEAITTVEPVAVAADEAVAAEAFEFDDLFPRREPVEPSPLGAWHSWTTLEGIAAETSEAPVPTPVVERAAERAVQRAPERPEWVQLVESLRIDVERRRSEQPSIAPKPVRKTPARPIQDEWGLFDPAQCGFAALLSKLDEITDASESRPRRSA
jgi:hypothetical protein